MVFQALWMQPLHSSLHVGGDPGGVHHGPGRELRYRHSCRAGHWSKRLVHEQQLEVVTVPHGEEDCSLEECIDSAVFPVGVLIHFSSPLILHREVVRLFQICNER